ncbi:MAG: hypothetical protein JEY96_14945 [Bacteroidales bacterium]|nr:hypothetical protein [Bacteroidales bacterium]
MHLFNTAIEISEFNGYLNREIVLKLRNGETLKGEIIKILKQGIVETSKADSSRYKKLHESPIIILFRLSRDNAENMEVKIKDILQFEFIY